MTQPTDKAKAEFEYALENFIFANPNEALKVLTGHFVGLTIAMLAQNGYKADGDVLIDGGSARNITIHKPKDTP